MEILIFFLAVLFGFVFGEVWVLITKRCGRKPFLGEYHLHHSLFGVLLFFIGFLTQGIVTVVLLGLGMGIIVQHTCREGFEFITKK
ncbi:MAG: hypothetical protein ABH807_02735 [Candidatus Shapirobacteria bacterium]